LQKVLNALASDADTMLKNKLLGFFHFMMMLVVIDLPSCLMTLHIRLCTHLWNICFLDKAAWTWTLTKELDAS
jgi:hypothetical protein